MFFKKNLIDELNSIETELGANVLKIGQSITENEEKIKEINKRINKLYQFLQKNNQELSDQQRDQISCISAIHGWALKIAGQEKKLVFESLEMALKYAKSSETIGLYHYVQASVVRGYGEFPESEASARLALEHFTEGSLNRSHTNHCLALALMRQDKLDQVEPYLDSASLILSSAVPLTKVEEIINTAEGSLTLRTNGNKAQFFEKVGRYSEALPLAKKVLAEKIATGYQPEDIAYTQISIGEILIKLNRHDEALDPLIESNAIYTKIHGYKPHANHLRVLIGLAKAYQKDGHSAEGALFLESAIIMAKKLGLKADHDFNKRIEVLQQILNDHASIQATI